MPCRYATDLEQSVSLTKYDPLTKKMQPMPFMVHKGIAEALKFLATEIAELKRSNHQINNVTEAQILDTKGILFDPEETILNAKKELKSKGKINVKTRKDVEIAIAAIPGEEAIAAIPEAWAVRSGTDRPQLVVTYAEKFASGKLGSSRWTLTIPHFRGAAGSRPSVPSYRRGPWQGTLQLNDGATIIVNCASSSEARRTLNRLKILTDNSKRMRGGKAILPIIKENPNSTIKEVSIIPLNVKFFATGQTDMTPTWSKSLR